MRLWFRWSTIRPRLSQGKSTSDSVSWSRRMHESFKRFPRQSQICHTQCRSASFGRKQTLELRRISSIRHVGYKERVQRSRTQSRRKLRCTGALSVLIVCIGPWARFTHRTWQRVSVWVHRLRQEWTSLHSVNPAWQATQRVLLRRCLVEICVFSECL